MAEGVPRALLIQEVDLNVTVEEPAQGEDDAQPHAGAAAYEGGN